MKKNLKRTLSIILSLCLVLSFYQSEIRAKEPETVEDYKLEYCGKEYPEDDKLQKNKNRIYSRRKRLC